MFRISELLHDFYYLNQGNLTISEYFGELKSHWKEIETFMPIPNSKCSIQCSCGVIPLVRGYREQSYVIRFLKGLNEQYAPVRSQIMLIDPLLNINKAFSLLSQQERQFNIPNIPDPEPQNRVLTLSTNQESYKNINNNIGNNPNFRGRGSNTYRGKKSRFTNGGRNQGNKLCTHCQRTNHTIETCFIKHGYPPGFQNNRFTKMENHTIGFPLDQSNEDSELQPTKSAQGTSKVFRDEQVQEILDLMHNAKAGDHTVNSAIHTKTSPASPETQFDKKLKCLRSDNGVEFLMHDHLSKKGIIHQRTCVETPQQNGIVERKHQHILNIARVIFFQFHLPSKLWNFAIQHATHIINRLPSPLLKQQNPYQSLHKSLPPMDHLRVFGCLAYATTLLSHRTKFQPRAIQAVFLGYKEGTKGFILYNLHTHSVFISRNTIFYEQYFPFQYNHSHDINTNSICKPTPPSTDTPILDPNDNTHATLPNSQSLSHDQHISSPQQSIIQPTRQSTRIRNPPYNLQDYHCSLSTSTPQQLEPPTGTLYPLSSCISYTNCASSYSNFYLVVSTIPEPSTYKKASSIPCWQEAMTQELQAL
ncbi:PREDICTED: uncharacterized protein LOC109327957 [Lupinus angustifolius]|uniref:uncharacterized protein LOC109327957 n=1 Tax=Lupinus angustifolius TaxID=3871 RepID=UPI00092FD878|nr:PREDICTED: uncharacterized protein LOC109327957 [Lupinus angustifolius]